MICLNMSQPTSSLCCFPFNYSCFFFNATATTEIYTLSLHDALPISLRSSFEQAPLSRKWVDIPHIIVDDQDGISTDRKSTRLNSSHTVISYAVFCLKKKKNITSISRCVER